MTSGGAKSEMVFRKFSPVLVSPKKPATDTRKIMNGNRDSMIVNAI